MESTISVALVELESNVTDLKAALRPLQFASAKELEVGHGKKAIVIFVPVPLLQSFHKIQQRYASISPYDISVVRLFLPFLQCTLDGLGW